MTDPRDRAREPGAAPPGTALNADVVAGLAPVWLVLWRELIAADLAELFGVDRPRVTITDDPRSDPSGHAMPVFTLDFGTPPALAHPTLAPGDAPDRIVIGGMRGLSVFSGTCPRCRTHGLPVIAMAQLLDRDRRARTGHTIGGRMRFTLELDPDHPCTEPETQGMERRR
jgi:hypothetical protein